MARIDFSPFKLVRKTRAWWPVVPLVFALILGGLSMVQARKATLLETQGVVTVAEVLDRERRETRDSEGNRTVRYYVTYRFQPDAGPEIRRRVRVSSRFYSSVAVGRLIDVRYVSGDPATHEYEIGATRADAEAKRWMAAAALSAAVALAVWLYASAAPMLRALIAGEVRRARVTEHLVNSRRGKSGGRYGRIRWIDETGASGESGKVPMLDVAGHPVGCRIMVVVDRKTGRGFWEEELAAGDTGIVNPFVKG